MKFNEFITSQKFHSESFPGVSHESRVSSLEFTSKRDCDVKGKVY